MLRDQLSQSIRSHLLPTVIISTGNGDVEVLPDNHHLQQAPRKANIASARHIRPSSESSSSFIYVYARAATTVVLVPGDVTRCVGDT